MKRSFRPGRVTDFPLWTNKPRLHHPARYGIFVQFKEGLIFDHARSVHGSPYAYDRLVPVIFYGPWYEPKSRVDLVIGDGQVIYDRSKEAK